MTQNVMSKPKRTFQAPHSQTDASMLQRLRWNINDTIVITQRNLMNLIRQPQLIVFATVQPVIFLLLFTFVFGGAISLGGAGGSGDGSYINFLLPGIIIQTAVFAATNTTVGLSDDLSKGLIDRFRSLPMGRGAVLAGRTISDAIRGLFTITIMVTVGVLIGFRPEGGVLGGLAAVLLAVGFGYAFTWISAFIGLFIKNPEAAQVAGFIWVFPLVFASSIFVPTATMPDWLRVFAENQPISRVANATRGLFTGTADVETILIAIAWIIAIIAVAMPLAVRQYRQMT